jgi:hypothetical protein
MALSFNITLFKELTEKYPSWNEFQSWLESEDGGFLRIIDSGEHQCIIRYDKSSSLLNLPHVRWFRSVIWDKVNHCPISIAPARVSSDEYQNKDNIEDKDSELVWEEYVDGFMIQCYYGKNDDELKIATRSKRDASGTFYSEKSFRTLFLEAYGSIPNIDKPAENEGECAIYYSYVVQHPEHRMVSPISVPRVILVQKGTIYEDRRVKIEDHFDDLNNSISNDCVRYNEYENKMDWVRDVIGSRPWTFRGLIAKNKKGDRWKFTSDKYNAIQSLRGNEATVYERYARIFSQNLSGIYLEYFPEDMTLFCLCSVFIHHIIDVLYYNYCGVFIHKTTTFAQVNKMFHPHLYAIHGVYLSKLRPSKLFMTPQEIRLYLTQLPPARIAFLIRKQQDEYHSLQSQDST